MLMWLGFLDGSLKPTIIRTKGVLPCNRAINTRAQLYPSASQLSEI